MSFGKCFYCEQGLAEGDEEVDHYIELAEDPKGAFRWANLYLSCKRCNDKLPHRAQPVSACLDPCDPAVQPHEHLTFEGELIRARHDSDTGSSTIRKYALHRDDLNLKRIRHLRRFDAKVREIHERMIADGRKEIADGEKEDLRRFAQRDHPFSLMFAVHLAANGL